MTVVEPHVPRLPGFRDVTPVSSGSTSLVFRGVQARLNRTVAIKVLLVDAQATTHAEYVRELETTVLLSSQPHIVGIIDTGVTEAGNPYIVMEYCPGGSYAQILQQRGALPVDEVVDLGMHIADALHAAHQVGIVHRDVKPSNILRSAFGPALADFGIARASHELHGGVADDRLTPYHAAPEAMRRQPQSPASDVYGLASTMWHLLAGRPPFADPTRPLTDLEDLRRRVLTEPAAPIPRPDVPAWLQQELARALAKDPGQRHPSAHAFAEALRYQAYRSRGPAAEPTAHPAAPAPQVRWPQAAPTRRSEFPDAPARIDPTAVEEAAAATIAWSGQPVEPDPAAAPVAAPAGEPAPPGTPPPVASPPPPVPPRPVAPLPPVPPPPPSAPATAPGGRPADHDLGWPGDNGRPRHTWLIAAGAGVLLLLALVGIGVYTGLHATARGTDPPPPPAAAQPGATRTVVPKSKGAPTGVKLTDEQTSITVSWTDPTQGTVQFAVLGGPSGEQPQLRGGGPIAPGTTKLTVMGVNPALEYCFVVEAFYSVDEVAQSSPVCTHRHG